MESVKLYDKDFQSSRLQATERIALPGSFMEMGHVKSPGQVLWVEVMFDACLFQDESFYCQWGPPELSFSLDMAVAIFQMVPG